MDQVEIKQHIDEIITTSKNVLGGTPVFRNTRVPVQLLFDYLHGGDSLEEFLDNYPTVEESVAKQVIELTSSYLLTLRGNEDLV